MQRIFLITKWSEIRWKKLFSSFILFSELFKTFNLMTKTNKLFLSILNGKAASISRF